MKCVDKTQSVKNVLFTCRDCYYAKLEMYTSIRTKITNSIQKIGMDFSAIKVLHCIIVQRINFQNPICIKA